MLPYCVKITRSMHVVCRSFFFCPFPTCYQCDTSPSVTAIGAPLQCLGLQAVEDVIAMGTVFVRIWSWRQCFSTVIRQPGIYNLNMPDVDALLQSINQYIYLLYLYCAGICGKARLGAATTKSIFNKVNNNITQFVAPMGHRTCWCLLEISQVKEMPLRHFLDVAAISIFGEEQGFWQEFYSFLIAPIQRGLVRVG